MMKTVIVVLFTVIFFCGCADKGVKHGEDSARECPPCQIPEKCIALLAYVLLSDDDIPFGDACDGIVPDSLVMFLQMQKSVFKDWQRRGGWRIQRTTPSFGDRALLQWLIFTRVSMEKGGKTWGIDAQATMDRFGGDNIFVWRNFMLGYVKDEIMYACKFDSLIENATFSETASCFDASLNEKSLSAWCEEVKYAAHELKKFSKDSSFSQDFLLRYYDSRCNAEELSNEELEELLSIENSNKRTEPRDGDAGECPPCSLSEKCIALLAYGLLSNDEQDVPFGGTCKDIAPDSLVEYLRLQKRIFKRWEKTKEIDTNDIKLGTAYAGEKDIGLLQSLILDRIRKGSGIGNKPRK